MDFNQPTQDFQQWLESLDEAEVRAEVEAVERDRENLQRRQELLEQAVALKHEWLALSPPDGSQTSVSEGRRGTDHLGSGLGGAEARQRLGGTERRQRSERAERRTSDGGRWRPGRAKLAGGTYWRGNTADSRAPKRGHVARCSPAAGFRV